MVDMPDFVRVAEPNLSDTGSAWRAFQPQTHHIYVNEGYGIFRKFITLAEPQSEEAEYLCEYLNQGYLKFVDGCLTDEEDKDHYGDA